MWVRSWDMGGKPWLGSTGGFPCPGPSLRMCLVGAGPGSAPPVPILPRHRMAGGKLMGKQTLELVGLQDSGDPGTGTCQLAPVGSRWDSGPTAQRFQRCLRNTGSGKQPAFAPVPFPAPHSLRVAGPVPTERSSPSHAVPAGSLCHDAGSRRR